jgi:hypothetical protein
VSDKVLQRRARQGVFERLPRGVYRVCGAQQSWHHLVLAACLCGGDECAASHTSAAALHRYDGSRIELVEVTVPRGKKFRCDWAVVHESNDFAAVDRTFVGTIPVTTPERTLIDLAAVSTTDAVEESFDGAERDRLVVADTVAGRYAQLRRRGRGGVATMARVLNRRTHLPPRHVIARRFARLLERAGITSLEHEYEIVLPDGRRRYVDVARPDLLLAWELDGQGSHATRRQRAADHVRADEIGDLGWRISRITYEQVMYEPSAVVRRVRRAIRSRTCRV